MPYVSVFASENSTAGKPGNSYNSPLGLGTVNVGPARNRKKEQEEERKRKEAQRKAEEAAKREREANSFLGKAKAIGKGLADSVKESGSAISNTGKSIVQGAKGENKQARESNQKAAASYDKSMIKSIFNTPVVMSKNLASAVDPTKKTRTERGLAGGEELIKQQKEAAKNKEAATFINKKAKQGKSTVEGNIKATQAAAEKKPVSIIKKIVDEDQKKAKNKQKQMAGAAVELASNVVGGGALINATRKEFIGNAANTATAAGFSNIGATVVENPDATVKDLATAGITGMAAGAVLAGGARVIGKPIADAMENSKAANTFLEAQKRQTIFDLVNKSDKPAMSATQQKALDDVMATIKPGKAVRQQQAAQTQAANASAKAAETNAKLDQKIELIEAKKADGKFTNVDKVKVEQLQAQKVPTGTGAGAATTPGAQLADAAVPALPARPVVDKSAANQALPANDTPVAKTELNTNTTPEVRRLKPTETAHMEPIDGYTHSDNFIDDYAETLRAREKEFKGGQIVDRTGHKEAHGSGKARISEHSAFYRAFYKENKRAPTKADYREQAIRELESGKGEYGASDSYKKLVDRESKPVPRIEVAPATVKDVPKGDSKVAKRVASDLKEKFSEIAQYDKITIKDQAEKAARVLDGDPAQLDRYISGADPLPDGLRPTALVAAIRQTGDVDLIRKTARSPLASESSYGAQELRLARENADGDPVQAIKSITKAREKAVEARLGKSVKEAVKEERAAIVKEKPKVTRQDWNSFIESIKC